MKRGERRHFEPEGVVVRPPDTASVTYSVESKAFGAFRDTPLPSDIHPIRAVFRFDLSVNGEPVALGRQFETPIEVEVRWTAADFRHAKRNGRDLTLIIDYGTGWKPAPDVEMVPDQEGDLGGVAILRISEWGDPRVGWAD